MKQTVFILITTLAVLGLDSCKKEGCTDPDAVNYDQSFEKDNGSCAYRGYLRLWHNLVTADSLHTFDNQKAFYYSHSLSISPNPYPVGQYPLDIVGVEYGTADCAESENALPGEVIVLAVEMQEKLPIEVQWYIHHNSYEIMTGTVTIEPTKCILIPANF